MAIGQSPAAAWTDEPGVRNSLPRQAHAKPAPSTTPAQHEDPRIRAFLAAHTIFPSIIFGPEIYEPDLYDVDAIHREARVAFAHLVDQSQVPQREKSGRILLIQGESGTGKSHLLRAFRCHTQEAAHGFATYIQLHTSESNYERYLLRCIVHSLSMPYSRATGDRTGLQQLARGLVQLLDPKLQAVAVRLMQTPNAALPDQCAWIERLCEALQGCNELRHVSANVLRVLLHSLAIQPRTASGILTFLQCEPMTPSDCALLGGVTPLTEGDAAFRMICQLSLIAEVTQQAPMVLMFDQAEPGDVDATERPLAMLDLAYRALQRVLSTAPSVVVVLACLSDMYKVIEDGLTKSALDRMVSNPLPQRLKLNRSEEEVRALVSDRLSWAFAKSRIPISTQISVFPIPEQLLLASTVGLRTRDVLNWCHAYHQRCVAAGRILETGNGGDPSPSVAGKTMTAAWQRVRKTKERDLEDDEDLIKLLRETALSYAEEGNLDCEDKSGANGSAHIKLSRGDTSIALTLAVTNKGYHRGAFGLQLGDLRKAAARTRTPIAIRTSPFPRGKASDAALEALRAHGGEAYVLDTETLQTMLALRALRAETEDDDEQFECWLRETKPLSSLPILKQIFGTTRQTSAGD